MTTEQPEDGTVELENLTREQLEDVAARYILRYRALDRSLRTLFLKDKGVLNPENYEERIIASWYIVHMAEGTKPEIVSGLVRETRSEVTDREAEFLKDMYDQGVGISTLARVSGRSKSTVHSKVET